LANESKQKDERSAGIDIYDPIVESAQGKVNDQPARPIRVVSRDYNQHSKRLYTSSTRTLPMKKEAYLTIHFSKRKQQIDLAEGTWVMGLRGGRTFFLI